MLVERGVFCESANCVCQSPWRHGVGNQSGSFVEDLLWKSPYRRADDRHAVPVGGGKHAGLTGFDVGKDDSVIFGQQGLNLGIGEPPIADVGSKLSQPAALAADITGPCDTEMDADTLGAEQLDRLHKKAWSFVLADAPEQEEPQGCARVPLTFRLQRPVVDVRVEEGLDLGTGYSVERNEFLGYGTAEGHDAVSQLRFAVYPSG